jgi:hypothetical protein
VERRLPSRTNVACNHTKRAEAEVGGSRVGSSISRLMDDHHGDPRGEEHEVEQENIPLALVRRSCCVPLLGSNDFEKFDLEY